MRFDLRSKTHMNFLLKLDVTMPVHHIKYLTAARRVGSQKSSPPLELFWCHGIPMLNRDKYAVFPNCGELDGEEVPVGRNGWKE